MMEYKEFGSRVFTGAGGGTLILLQDATFSGTTRSTFKLEGGEHRISGKCQFSGMAEVLSGSFENLVIASTSVRLYGGRFDTLTMSAKSTWKRLLPNANEYAYYDSVSGERLTDADLAATTLTNVEVRRIAGECPHTAIDGNGYRADCKTTFAAAPTVTIDETYTDTVTVNGADVELDENGSFILAAAEGEQTIVAVDRAGNTAEMTVTVNDGHTFGDRTANGDGTHARKCTVDGCAGSETEKCAGGKATCKAKAVCAVCGDSYGEIDPDEHDDLTHVEAKAATADAEGNVEYWVCSGCGKYYRDAAATEEIDKADTVIKKPETPKTGDDSAPVPWAALALIGGAAPVLTAGIRRRRAKA